MISPERRGLNRRDYLWLALALALGLVFGLHHVSDPDLFQQAAMGRADLTAPLEVGRSDFHFLYRGYPFIADKWLAGVIAAGWAGAGSHGLALYQLLLTAAAAAAWFLLFRTASGSAAAASAGTALALAAGAFRLEPRPELWSTVLQALLTAALLAGWPERRLRWAVGLGMALWVNLHGYFINGLLVLAAAAAAALFPPSGPLRRRPGRQLVLLLVGTVACLAHPQGPAATAWPLCQLWILRTEPVLREAIQEFFPTSQLFEHLGALRWGWVGATLAAVAVFSSGRRFAGAWGRSLAGFTAALPWLAFPPPGLVQWPYRLTVALAVAAIFEIWPACRERRLFPVFLFCGFAALAWPLGRNLALVPPAALLLLVPAWARAARDPAGGHRVPAWVLILAPLCLTLAAGWARLGDRLPSGTFRAPSLAGWGADERTLPLAAARFVAREKLPGEVLNDFQSGGALLFAWYPERRVFIAGNTSLYPAEFLERYRREVMAGTADPAALAGRFGVRTILLSHAAMETPRLISRLAGSPQWALVYLDQAAAVWTLRGGEREEWIAAHTVDLDAAVKSLRGAGPPAAWLPAWLHPRPAAYPALNLAEFLLHAGRPDLAFEEAERIGRGAPHPAGVALSAAAADRAGRLSERVLALEKARACFPAFPEIADWLARACFLRGALRADAGDLPAAAADFRRADEVRPGVPGTLIAWARVEAALNHPERARELLGKARKQALPPELQRLLAEDPLLAPFAVRKEGKAGL